MTDLDGVYGEAVYSSITVGPDPDYKLALDAYVAGDGVADAGDSLSFYGNGTTRFRTGDLPEVPYCPKGVIGW